MNAKELRKENERLRKLLAEAQAELTQSQAELTQSQTQLAQANDQLQETQAQHEAAAAQFTQTLEAKQRNIASLEHQIKLLLQRIRGSRQERIDPDQLLLFSLEELREIAEQLEQGAPEEDLIADGPRSKRRRNSPGRVGKLPEHLDREIIRHELDAEERPCPCCGELRQEIGIESSEQLELIPARLKVLQHDRVKYACRRCEEHVAIAEKPPQPIEKGLPAPGLCAHTVLSKFGDHQPLYRQEDIHSRLGYSGYDGIYAGDLVWEVACWIHARRYWHQAIDNDPVRANTALGFIARLSQIETQLRQAYPCQNLQGERDFAAVAAGRQQHAVPILTEFKAWLDHESEDRRILPKSPIRAAFTYTLNQWKALCRYTQEGYLSYDNNIAERLVKISAIGRKNYLFVGSVGGGRGAAVMYSLVSSAKANGVEPFAWLRDVFKRLPEHRGGEAFDQAAEGAPVTSSELDDLLPDRWLHANPDHVWTIDKIRREERKQKNEMPRRRSS